MDERIALNPKATALMVMDFQTLIVENYCNAKEELLSRTQKLIEAARTKDIKIIYVVVAFRRGYPEIHPSNSSFRMVRENGILAIGSASADIHPRLAPQEGDVIITKHRVGAFWGTDLDMILRANGIDTMLLTGIATSGVVLSTVRYAADADYRLVVIEDCCADRDEEVHRVLIRGVFPRQARIASSEEIMAIL